MNSKLYLFKQLKMIFKKIYFLAFYYIREFLLSKVFYIIIFFLFFSFIISSLVGVLAVTEEKKVLLDLFLAATYLTSILFSVIYPPVSITNEIETKRIYIIISKSVYRYEWFLAKFVSFIISSIFLIVISNLVFFIFMYLFKGYTISLSYLNEILFIILKIIVIISLSMSFTFITTSIYSTILITTMFWIASHFTNELRYSLANIKSVIDYFAYISYLLPNFSYQNLNINLLFHYIFYSIAWLYLSLLIFEKKEL